MLFEMRLRDAQRAAFLKGEESGIAKGKQIGERHKLESVIMGMLEAGIDYEVVAKVTKLSLDEIKDIAAKHDSRTE